MKKKKKREYLIWIVLILLFIAITIESNAQIDTAVIYKTDRPAMLINSTQTILSYEYVDVLLEPIPGKQTRWKIIREEVDAIPVITTVEDKDLTYSGTWINATGTWGSVTYSSEVGATAKYVFTGNKVEVIADLAPNHGVLGYTINSGSEKTVSLFAAVRKNGQVVISEPVPAGLNTITFRVISNTVLIDKLIITR